MSSQFRFEDPPPAARGGRKNSQLEAAEALRGRPGEWGMVVVCVSRTSAGSMARAIRLGKTKTWLPAGDFEAATRTVDGEHRVYARYVPDTESGDE